MTCVEYCSLTWHTADHRVALLCESEVRGERSDHELHKGGTHLPKHHPDLNEKWVQTLIKDDPSILGLGDLEFRDMEKMQPHAGRLDLLLEDPDPDTGRRYEVEIQLRTDK